MEIKLWIYVGQEYGAIASFELNITDAILSDVMNLTQKNKLNDKGTQLDKV